MYKKSDTDLTIEHAHNFAIGQKMAQRGEPLKLVELFLLNHNFQSIANHLRGRSYKSLMWQLIHIAFIAPASLQTAQRLRQKLLSPRTHKFMKTGELFENIVPSSQRVQPRQHGGSFHA